MRSFLRKGSGVLEKITPRWGIKKAIGPSSVSVGFSPPQLRTRVLALKADREFRRAAIGCTDAHLGAHNLLP